MGFERSISEIIGIKTIDYLSESGYFRLNLKDAVVIGDVAQIGPDYIGIGTLVQILLVLSFQCLVIVSWLTPERLYMDRISSDDAGTAAHNTVTIDGEDSSEVWGGFRVARRARPIDLEINANDKFIGCAHLMDTAACRVSLLTGESGIIIIHHW